MAVTDGLLLLAAFVLGAWVRQPFAPARLPGRKNENSAADVEDKRQKQLAAMLNYGLDDARRAARESRRGA